jgi:hypothetical protein
VSRFAESVTRAVEKASPLRSFRLGVTGARLLGERAEHRGVDTSAIPRRRGVSETGATRLIRTADGWLSLTLSRSDDYELLPACFERDMPQTPDPWTFAETAARDMSSVHIRDRAVLLGLSCAIPNEHSDSPLSGQHLTAFPPAARQPGRMRVVDLSALWAGPLCARLLRERGATVTTVEDPARPDGMRVGSPSFYEALHQGHVPLPVSFATPTGREQLSALIAEADVVITSARPRAFEQLGIDPLRIMSDTSICAWVAITGFGQEQTLRIGFGDDAAIAGGLVNQSTDGPDFIGDAIADPLTGLSAAAIALHAFGSGTRVFADLSLASVAARAGHGAHMPGLLAATV